MKRYIRSSTIFDSNSQEVLDILENHGIDCTPHTYEIYAEDEDTRRRYHRRFTANGDYLALFAMLSPQNPDMKTLSGYFDNLDEFEKFVNDFPTFQNLKNFAYANWSGWEGGRDYVTRVKNLDRKINIYEED